MSADATFLRTIEDRASWLAIQQVHWANNKPENQGKKPKVGGHQASVTSASTILSALYLSILRPQDRLAVKPHSAPFLYALMYLMGKISREEMMNLREFGGLQPYPTQHEDPDFVHYSTSIEGLGVAATIEDAYVAQVQRDQLGLDIDPRYHAHCGDGELTELQIGGSLHEAGRRRLGNVTWWVDINRQTLDRIVEDSPHGSVAAWARALFEANGWHVVELRWGKSAEAAFNKRGGQHLRSRLESFSDAEFQPLLLLPGDVIRKALVGETGHDDEAFSAFLNAFKAACPIPPKAGRSLKNAIKSYDDDALKALIEDLGGHDLDALIAADRQAQTVTDQPTAILCHTVKGWRLPFWSGHPENHGALLSEALIEEYRQRVGGPDDDPWATFEGGSQQANYLSERATQLFPPSSTEMLPYPTDRLPTWDDARILFGGKRSTSAAFGQLNTRYLKSDLGPYLHFIAPDVGLTTHLGGVITTTGVYEHREEGVNLTDFLIKKKQAAFAWRLSRQGQFHSVAINEGVAAMKLFAFGRRHMAIEGKRQYIAIGTIYDVFWKHAYTQLYYSLYDNARFMAVGTPSGTSLSRESGTHQSVQTPAILMGMPGIVAFEPAYAIDTAVIYRWGLAQMGDDDGESIYLRLSTQELMQPWGDVTPAALEARGLPSSLPPLPQEGDGLERLKHDIIEGAYWLRHPLLRPEGDGHPAGYNPRSNVVHIFATGPVMEEALMASRRLEAEHGIFAPVLNVTSWDKLYRGYRAHWEAVERWGDEARSYHLNDLIPDCDVGVPTVVVADAAPMVADWLGSALGRPVRTLGPTEYSQVGDVSALRRHHDIDAEAVVLAAREELAAG